MAFADDVGPVGIKRNCDQRIALDAGLGKQYITEAPKHEVSKTLSTMQPEPSSLG